MDASELERLDARLRDEVNVPTGDDARIRASLETAALYVERAIGGYCATTVSSAAPPTCTTAGTRAWA